MTNFHDTNHCLSHAHCQTCRDLESGRAWRASIVQAFAVDGVDFACPLNHPWGYIPPPREPQKPAPSYIAERAAICKACTDGECDIKRIKSCERDKTLADPRESCTDTPPKWNAIAPS